MTCERCGADAVDARGRCHNCGWQMPTATYTDQGSSPSLGETRAAQVPAGTTGRTGAVPPTQGAGANPARPVRALGGGLPPVPASGGRGSRYCGTCGAPLEPGRAFCGQCGTPVAEAGGYGAAVPAGAQRYQVGSSSERWVAEDGDSPTEEFSDVPPAYQNPYGSSPVQAPLSGPYGANMGYTSGVGAPPLTTPSGNSRSVRIVLGMLCLLGSAVSAVAAILLAGAK